MVTLTFINNNINLSTYMSPITLSIATSPIIINQGDTNIIDDNLILENKTFSSYKINSTYIPKSIINAKGDLIIGDLYGQPSRLPIGSPDYILIVDPNSDRGFNFTKIIDGGTF
ncbi:hypothetical protein [Rosettibacter firmus]|uniref:hypothetical protein n=1 Tax=Rosettibacter firmus TaxID=3111522 RepID=UPI00336C1323